MKLSRIGEFGLIARVAAQTGGGPAVAVDARLVAGIGDDCAVIRQNAREALLVTTDIMAEGVHFERALTPPEALGRKLIAVNVSDIAAMGGSPEAAVVGVSLPSSTDVAWTDALTHGLAAGAHEYGLRIVGGDTTRSRGGVFLSLTLWGRVPLKRLKRRDGARPGDLICVTGAVGGAAAGLRSLRLQARGGDTVAADRALITAYQVPRAHLDEGRWLARQVGVNAMIDISDGLRSDLAHVARMSRVGARVAFEKIPVLAELVRVARQRRWPLEALVLGGGEDYCLLAAVDPAAWARVAASYKRRFRRPLWAIGTFRAARRIDVMCGGRMMKLSHLGYDHFRDDR